MPAGHVPQRKGTVPFGDVSGIRPSHATSSGADVLNDGLDVLLAPEPLPQVERPLEPGQRPLHVLQFLQERGDDGLCAKVRTKSKLMLLH